MLVFEIAAGIVLGVLALAALPALLRGVQFMFGLVVILAAIGAVAFFAFIVVSGWPDTFYFFLTIVGIPATIGLIGWWSHKTARMPSQLDLKHKAIIERLRDRSQHH
jgi:hypothetical protein